MALLIPGLIGLLFGFGIILSGMVNPAKVMNFLDLFGSWDPSLAFVMGGALAVTAIGYRAVRSQAQPLLGGSFHWPGQAMINGRLIAGAALFGLGWGVTGFCPGGAIPGLSVGVPEVWVFVLAMLLGIAGTRLAMRSYAEPRAEATELGS